MPSSKRCKNMFCKWNEWLALKSTNKRERRDYTHTGRLDDALRNMSERDFPVTELLVTIALCLTYNSSWLEVKEWACIYVYSLLVYHCTPILACLHPWLIGLVPPGEHLDTVSSELSVNYDSDSHQRPATVHQLSTLRLNVPPVAASAGLYLSTCPGYQDY